MTRYVALLRGINVGSHKRVAMADLRDLLDSLGHGDVVTHLQSGNVLFSSDRRVVIAIAREIEVGIAAQLGLDVRVLLRTAAELRRIVAANPLPEAAADPSRFHVTFLSADPTREQVAGIDSMEFAPDQLRFGDGVLYVWFRGGILASKLFNGVVQRRLGLVATSRNWKTVTRLHELASSETQTRGASDPDKD